MNFVTITKSLVVCLLLAGSAAGDYRSAVVQVGCFDGRGSDKGGGVLVCRADGGIVLTVAHIFTSGGQPWVEWHDGTRSNARLVGVDRQRDIAFLQCGPGLPGDADVIEIAEPGEYPPLGASVDFIGFGGGQRREFTTNTIGYDGADLQLGFVSISGDSGGPVLHAGKVVGIQYGHNGRCSLATYCGAIRAVATQCRVPVCRGGVCRPQYQPQVRPAPGAPIVAAPQQPKLPLAAVPPQPAPHQPVATHPAGCRCECKELIASLRSEMALLKSQQPVAGPAGPPGPIGPRGPQGEPGVAVNPSAAPLSAKFRVSVTPVPKSTKQP